MKLSKKEISSIAELFTLGKVNNSVAINGGLVNYNYILQTLKGKFIIRIVGKNDKNKLSQLKLQFKVADYLEQKSFPYEIPIPLKTNRNQQLITIKGRYVWVYKMINGKNSMRPSSSQMCQLAEALAIYHKYIKGFKAPKQKDDSNKRIITGFSKMHKMIAKTEAEKFALKHIEQFENIFNETSKIKCSMNELFIHSDFDSTNVLFDKGKLKGIIDFDELHSAPRIYDVSISIRDSCYTKGKLDMEKAKIFLKEYEKISKLSKKEKRMIIPIILYESVDYYVWIVIDMQKEADNKKKYLKEMVVLTKDIIETGKKF